MITRCRQCNKPIALNETAWTCGPMFCSHKCGVDWAKTLYENTEYTDDEHLTRIATAYFDEVAEEISREAYGAMDYRWTAHDERADVTTIFHTIVEGSDILQTEVTGFYFGWPNDRDTDEFDNRQYIATFEE